MDYCLPGSSVHGILQERILEWVGIFPTQGLSPGLFMSPANIGGFFTTSSASLVAQLIKESTCNVGDLGSIAGLGRSPGEGKGYPLQYYGLENCMDCIILGVAKSST